MYSLTGFFLVHISKMKTIIMKKFLQSSKALLMGLFLFIAGAASSQVQFNLHGITSVNSIATGSPFVYTLQYSASSYTVPAALNAVATIVLPSNVTPANISPFSSSISYNVATVSGATYNAGTNTITINFVSSLNVGTTGSLDVTLKYKNGTTPNGYAPNIYTSIDASNNLNPDGSTGPFNSDTLKVTAIASNKFTVSKSRTAGGAINDLSIFKIDINSNSGSTGGLFLKNPVVIDTLFTDAEFVEATPFNGSNLPVYQSHGSYSTVTWTWPSGAGSPETNADYSSSAYISIKYKSPTYAVGTSACNYATISGSIPTLPLGVGADSAVSKRNGTCNGIDAPSANAVCTGGGITAATAWWLDHHIINGTAGNSFSNGWHNSGNTQLDRVELTYTIDKSIDVSTINVRPVHDGFDSAAAALITVSYTTNLNHSFTTLGAYQSLDIAAGNIADHYTPSLAANEYLVQVKFVVTGSLPIGGYEDLTYYGDARTAALGAKDGSAITEGTTYDPSNVGDDGTTVENLSVGNFTYNGTQTSYSSCDNTVEILTSRPVFGYTDKSYTNSTTGGNYKASDTVDYQFHTYLGGTVNASSVVVTDNLDSRLSYVPGSATFVAGNVSSPITPIVTGQHLEFDLPTLTNMQDYYIRFSAVIAPGTMPASIDNQMAFTCPTTNVLFTGNTNTTTVNVISAVALRVKKGQSPNCGNDVSNFYYYPTIAHTIPGGPVKYKITISNLGNVVGKDLILIDAFPFANDYRGSQWSANMVAPPVVSDPYSTVYYTTTSNPCYIDLTPSINPPSCNTPSWSTTPPTDITTLKAIKLSRPANLNVFESVEITWSMRAPVGVPFGYVMNNSVSYQVTRADNDVQLLPATPNQVGMVADCISSLGSIGNYAWLDLNRNGLQDEAADKGLNGVKVYLYGAGADNAIGGGDDILLDSSITGNDFYGHPGYYLFPNLPDGKYYVNFPTVYNQNFITKTVTQTDKTDGNSDVNISTGNSELVTINIAAGGQDKDNTTIDAGYYPTGTLGNYVWFDNDADGIQNDGNSNGINGIKVVLLKDDGTGNFVHFDSTTTANDANNHPGYYNFVIENSGNYIVNFPTKHGFDILTTSNPAAGTDYNSDADGGSGNSPIIVMDVYNNGHDGIPKNNPTIDAGYHCTTDAGIDQTTCSGTVLTLTGTRPTSGTWIALGSNPVGNTLGATSGGVASLTVPVGVHGTFRYIYQSGYCTDTMDVVVIAKPNAGADQQVCGGKSATLTGTAPNNGTWTALGTNPAGATLGTTTAGVATVSFTEVSAGNYKFIYTLPTGCTDTMNVAVTPKPNAGADQAICAGSTAQLSGLILPTGNWSALSGNPAGGNLSTTTAGIATVSYTNAADGDYNYVYTSTFCTDTMKVTVVHPLAPITGTYNICVGANTTFHDATAGGTWSSSNTAVATVNPTTGVVHGVAGGYVVISYTVPANMACGCNIANFPLNVNTSPSLQPINGSAIVCVGSIITLTDNSGGGAWSSSDNSIATVNSSGNVTGVAAANNVTIYYTATNGCGSDVKSFDIKVCQPIASIVGSTDLCVGTTTTYTDATAGGTWSSSNNAVATVNASGLVTAVSAGYATISYTAPTGTSCCSDVANAYITVYNNPSLAPVNGPGTVCTGQIITLTDASGGGHWSSSNNSVATVNSSGNVLGVAAGSATISYSTTNVCGTTSQSATVVVGGLPMNANQGNNIICVGSTTTLTNAAAGGTWSSSDNNIATVDNMGVVTGIAAGHVTISYTVSAGSVCGSNVATSIVYVNATPTLAPITGGGVVCVGSVIALNEPSGGGVWSSSDNSIAYVNNGYVRGMSAGTAIITYTANYYCSGVLHTLTQTTTVYPQDAITYITGNSNICLGNNSTLSCSTIGGTWSSSDNSVATVNSTTGVVHSVSVGNAIITYTVSAGSVCGANSTFTTVNVTSTPSVAPILGTTTLCANNTTTLTCASGGGNWSSSDPSVASINTSGNVLAVSAGTTNITYTATTTCGTGSQSVTFTVLALPATPTISGSLLICNGSSAVLTSSAANNNQWYKDGVAINGATGHTLSVSTPGSYKVSYSNGTCTSPLSAKADVNSGVANGFTINLNPQELGGNNFIFTSATPTTGNSYVWDLGDGTSSTAVNPSRTYAAADTYAVKQIVTGANGCIDSTTHLAYVFSCCVTSGYSGGVESKSLGNVISQRFINRVTNSASEKLNYAQLNKVVAIPGIQVLGFGGNVSLQNLLPGENSVASVLGGTISVYPTTPTDITTFTNALDVKAQDYTANTNCKAVAFATKTSGVIYNHTKPVCDRLKEAVLMDIQNVTVGNVNMVQYKLQQNTGVIEYAISFSAGKNASSNFYEIQSKWLTEDYSGLDTMYNFQIWGVNPQVVKSMVADVLNNLNNSLPYYQLTYSPVPQTYVMSHRRNQKSMDITINNKTAATSANLYVTDYMNELSKALPYRVIPVTINPNGKTVVSVDMEDKYQADVKLLDANNVLVNDEMYSNDGPWDINYNAANTSIQQFNITNDNLTTANNEWRLFRNVSVDAITTDFVSVYKLMKAASLPRDISKYSGLKFTANASGASALNITFVKNSITNWNNQYSITIPAKQGTQDYMINFSDLVAAGMSTIDASDVTAITISFMVNTGTSTHLNASISNARLVASTTPVQPSVESMFAVQPSLVTAGTFKCIFNTANAEKLTLNVIETGTGKVVHTEILNSSAGKNIATIYLNETLPNAHYIVTLNGTSTKFENQKVVIIK